MLAVTAYGTHEQQVQSKRAQAARSRADQARQRMAEAENIRAARQKAREAQQARAQIQAEAEARGMGSSSSAVQGAMGSVQSQLAGNLSFLRTQTGLNQYANIQTQEAGQAVSQQSMWQGITSISSSATDYKSIFD